MLDLDTVTVNGDSANLDFVVNGDAVAKMLFVDASSDVVGVGVAAPDTAYSLDVGATGTKCYSGSWNCSNYRKYYCNQELQLSHGNTTVGVAGAGILALPSVESVDCR